jgi:hypothetical protein
MMLVGQNNLQLLRLLFPEPSSRRASDHIKTQDPYTVDIRLCEFAYPIKVLTWKRVRNYHIQC